MKQFSCGDVVAGCARTFTAVDSDLILREVSAHSRRDHGLREVSADLVGRVLLAIRDVA